MHVCVFVQSGVNRFEVVIGILFADGWPLLICISAEYLLPL